MNEKEGGVRGGRGQGRGQEVGELGSSGEGVREEGDTGN